MPSRSGPWLFLAAGVVVVATLAVTWVLAPRPGRVARGGTLVRHLGCEGCHGPGGTGGVPNPRSDEGEVPALTGGTWMMYVESEDEIGEWILDGRPSRLGEAAAGPDALIQMPAYRGQISRRELADLVAWYKVASGYQPGVPKRVTAGRDVARRLGCFGCHGVGGREGVANPGSFKGYIPGWGSPDFDELVLSEGELREWILDGLPERLRTNPIARQFTQQQVVQMPQYRGVLADGELDALSDYILWVSRLGPADGLGTGGAE